MTEIGDLQRATGAYKINEEKKNAIIKNSQYRFERREQSCCFLIKIPHTHLLR